ncbi:MAG: T9SS type A sorting domain-containing protein [Flavobacteriales bacterium]|nr:T9SS type A sorting domain-containing protein [Flavobacteriales bacterium]
MITLDLSTAPLGGTLNNYMDTLHADYAFIITPAPFVKNMLFAAEDEVPAMDTGWDFVLYPNPARDELYVKMPDDTPHDITLLDLSGRRIQAWSSVTGPMLRLPLGQLAKGAYYVRVAEEAHSRTKKLIIH